ncbi:MAG: hypothetical protein JNL32_06445 [Candidatus Kapabacteria bacterium]|nr:hypothetical protein [Candidatus Kapabacteria bacterium]
MTTKGLLEEVVSVLTEKLSATPLNADVQMMLDNYDKWTPRAASADVLLHYTGSDAVADSKLRERNSFDVMLFARFYNGESGVFGFLQAIRNALDARRIAGAATPLQWDGTRFYNQKNGVWCYIISYSVTINLDNVQA